MIVTLAPGRTVIRVHITLAVLDMDVGFRVSGSTSFCLSWNTGIADTSALRILAPLFFNTDVCAMFSVPCMF